MLKEQKGNLKARFTGVISESETAQLKFKEIKKKSWPTELFTIKDASSVMVSPVPRL